MTQSVVRPLCDASVRARLVELLAKFLTHDVALVLAQRQQPFAEIRLHRHESVTQYVRMTMIEKSAKRGVFTYESCLFRVRKADVAQEQPPRNYITIPPSTQITWPVM